MTTAPDWPALMPGTDDDPRGPRAQAAALLDAAGHELAAIPELTDTALPENLRRVAQQATGSIAEVRQHVHRAAGRLDALAADDLIPERGKARLIKEAGAAAAAALREVDNRSSVAIDALEAGLTALAQPAFPAGADRGEAREELRLILDAAGDPAGAMRELAAGPDQRLAALAAGSYGASYLRSRGVPEDIIRATAVFAAQAALRSDDPARRAAARALSKVDSLRKARMKSFMAANFAIGWEGR